MKTLREYIESGILECYVLGLATSGEAVEVEEMAAAYSEIQAEIRLIREALEKYAELHAIEPSVTVKAMLFATIDYTERLKNGEPPASPPVLHPGSLIADYDEWLTDRAAVVPDDFKNLYARIIGHTPEVVTAIIWVKEFAPPEIHTKELETFLIIEGTCNITIGDELHELIPGDVLSIPLHISHHVKVTSEVPCKIILQRAAA